MKILILSLCLSVTFISGCASKSNFMVEDFLRSDFGKNSQGQVLDLKEMRGKVVIVTFWTSWCGYCLQELKALEKVRDEVGPDKLEIIAVNHKESARVFNKAKKQFNRKKITFTRDAKGKIGIRYGVSSYPHLLIFDKRGRLKGKHKGYSEKWFAGKVMKEINFLLESKV